jgi:hypothetical protein
MGRGDACYPEHPGILSILMLTISSSETEYRPISVNLFTLFHSLSVQRVPAAANSLMRLAFSWVTKPGPVMMTSLAMVLRFST